MIKNLPANAEDIDASSIPGLEDPLEEGMATHSSILPGESHGQKSLVGYSPWGLKESDMSEQPSTHTHARQVGQKGCEHLKMFGDRLQDRCG